MSGLWQRFKELSAIEDDDERDDKEGDLWAEHRKRVEESEPHPVCCERGAELRATQYADRLDEAPRFGVSVEKTWYPIQFCPFCAAPMPELVQAPQPGEHYMTCTDGGYYCDECSERLDGCYCLPRRCAWRIKA